MWHHEKIKYTGINAHHMVNFVLQSVTNPGCNYCQTSDISYTLGDKILQTCQCCSICIFYLNFTPGFNGLGKNYCKTRSETFKFLDLMCLILEVWQYMIISDLQGPVKGYWPLPWTQNYFIPNYLWNALSHLLSVLFGLIPLSVTQVWLNSTLLNFFLLLACLWQTLEGYARHRIKK